MKKNALIILIFALSLSLLFAGGKKDSATSSDRAMYLSGQGYITPAEEIEIDAYLSQVDYDYPLPENSAVNFILDAEQKGELAYLQLGMKAQKTPFKDLPKFNLAFVIDCSGSMSSANKMDWVKDSFEIFIENVRPSDYVSLIAFSNDASVYFPATQMKTYIEKQNFKNKVLSMRASGGTNIYAGLATGYQEVIANYDPSYNNRVILLTDGEHNAYEKTTEDIVNLATQYNKLDINVSCIALGTSADVNLMTDVAEEGGGSSRFISNHEKMVETFSTELDRLLVPAARDMKMKLTLAEGVQLLETWGYKNVIDGQNISYELDTIHNGDYETIVTELFISSDYDTSKPLAWFSYEYKNMDGSPLSGDSIPVYLIKKDPGFENTITNERVMQSEAYIRLARVLIDLSNRSNKIAELQRQYNDAYYNRGNSTVYTNGEPVLPVLGTVETTNSIMDEIIYQLDTCIQIVDTMHADLMRIDELIPGSQYTKDFQILDNYRATFQKNKESYLQFKTGQTMTSPQY